MDACADNTNYKHENYYTVETDGLKADWGGQTVFCNPPYSKRKKDKPGQEDWIEKAYKESSENGATVVMLIPARTDTIAFHEYILGKAQEIRFVKGRLKFETDRKANKEAAPFPSMIVIFRGSSTTKTNVEAYIQEEDDNDI
jgi:site-specific DNA-methyltransferase (adenine-specific)